MTTLAGRQLILDSLPLSRASYFRRSVRRFGGLSEIPDGLFGVGE